MFVHIRGGEGAKQRLTLYNDSQAKLATKYDSRLRRYEIVLFVLRLSSSRPPALSRATFKQRSA